MSKAMFNPLGDRVSVRLDERLKEVGGIVIPENAQKAASYGEVVAVGPTVRDVTVGNRVLLYKASGTHMTGDCGEFVILREGQVLGVVQ